MTYIVHSAKGKTWKKHKYLKIVNGRYVYPSKKKSSLKDKIGRLTGSAQRKEYEAARQEMLKQTGKYKSVEEKYRASKSAYQSARKDLNKTLKNKGSDKERSIKANYVLHTSKSLRKVKSQTLKQAKARTQANIAANEALAKYKKTPLYKIRKLIGKEK